MTTMSNSQLTHVDQLIKHLHQFLADTYVLYAKTQNFHWNVIDPRFYALHKLLEEQYEELAKAVDLIAEHIRTFNVPAPATLRQFLALTSLEEAEGIEDGDVMLLALYADHKSLIFNLRQWIAFADDNNDAATSDMMVERLRAHDKAAWMLRSHVAPSNNADI